MILHESFWTFTRQELWHLLGGFAPALLVGIPDPYFGREADRILGERIHAAASLRRKGFTGFPPGIQTPLGDALAACAHPALRLIITSQFAGSKQNRRTIFFHNGDIFEHRVINPEHQSLARIPSREVLLEDLAHDLRMDSNLPAAKGTFVIPEEDFFAANRACRDGDPAGAKRILSAGGTDEDYAGMVISALEKPSANASAISVRFSGETPIVAGWGILEGGGQVWMLRPVRRDGRKLTEWIPADSGIIRTALERMLP